jgi:two-component system chemotaxis response regulator CheY
MRFLIVDDSSTMRRIIINTLTKLGYETFLEAGNGREGLDRLGAAQVDLVITDWNMPEMNGIDALTTLRGSGSNVPFGFVTSEGSDEMRQRAASAGAAFLIAKPFTPEAFQEALAGLPV